MTCERAPTRHFWSAQKERISHWGILKTLQYYLLSVAPDKLGIQISRTFEYEEMPVLHRPLQNVTFSIVQSAADWTARDRQLLEAYEDHLLTSLFEGFFEHGDRCAVARWNGFELASLVWVRVWNVQHPTSEKPSYLIRNAFTLPDYRGRGLFSQLMVYCCEYLRRTQSDLPRVFVECSPFNFASKQGILKAGFVPAGATLSAFQRSWHWANRRRSGTQTH